MNRAKIIILAGGKGKRMGGEKPKVLALFNGRLIIDYCLAPVGELGLLTKPVVVVGFGAEMVKEYLGGRAEYAIQSEQLGTSHAVLCAKNQVEGKAETVVVLYADHPNTKSETVRRLLDLHQKERPEITMMTLTVPDFAGVYSAFYGFGRVVRDENGKIRKIVELKVVWDE